MKQQNTNEMIVNCKNVVLTITKKDWKVIASKDTEKNLDIDPVMVVAKILRRIADTEEIAS